MNTLQSILTSTLLATGLTLSPTVNAQTVKVQHEVADTMDAEFLYELRMEAIYTAGKEDHQQVILTLRDRFTDLVKFDTVSSDQSTNPEYIKANTLFEQAKNALIKSRAKYGIKWGEWHKKYIAKK